MSFERVKWSRFLVARYVREDFFVEYCSGLAFGFESAVSFGRNEISGAVENYRFERELVRDFSEKFFSETAEKSVSFFFSSSVEEKKSSFSVFFRSFKIVSKRKKGVFV